MSLDGSQRAGSDDGSPGASATDFASYLVPLERATARARGGVRRFGGKAFILAKFARAGAAVPEGWLLETSHFDSFLERSLPAGHDLRSLIKRSGSREGDEYCARAYEQLRSSSLTEELQAALAGFWASLTDNCPLGVAVRPSIAGSGTVNLAGRHLHARVGLRGPEELADAVVAVWASSVLSQAVSAYAEAGMKDMSLALLLQRVVPCDTEVWLSRADSRWFREDAPELNVPDVSGLDWYLGVSMDKERGPWRPRRSQFAPLSLGHGGAAIPSDIDALRRALRDADFEQLGELARSAEQLMGPEAMLQLALVNDCEGPRFQLLNALEGGRWLGLRGGTEATLWTEVVAARRGHEPALRLGQSLIEKTVARGLAATLATMGCGFDSERQLLSRWCGRSYLNASDLLRSVAELPALRPAEVVFAMGGLENEAARRLAAEVSVVQVEQSRTRKIWRTPQLANALLRLNLGLEAATKKEVDSIAHDAQGLSEMDLTLLPNDAIATTLRDAERLAQRSVTLWLQSMAAQWVRLNAVQTLIQRRVEDAEPQVAYRLCRGVDGLLGPTLAAESRLVVDAFCMDQQARHELLSGSIRRVEDLSDGRARAALGQFLVRYGDLALGPFGLSRPRWSEDSSDFLAMIRLLLSSGHGEVAPPSRVLADRAIASFEPDLSSLERRTLRYLIDKAKAAILARSRIDLVVYASLARLRRVILDADRRLRRIDDSIGVGGAFQCSLERLRDALASGRPELGRVIRMRRAERAVQRFEPAPPLHFLASPPRGARQVKGLRNLMGLGVSSGVNDGRVLRLGTVFPHELSGDEVVVLPALDPAFAPLLQAVRGVISGSGGALSLGAEAVRELGIPAVASAPRAMLELKQGESIRLDGGRGHVERLAWGDGD